MMDAFLVLAMTGLFIYAATTAYQGLAYAYVLCFCTSSDGAF